MTKEEEKAFPEKLRKKKAKGLCDCYAKHKAGCNLILKLSKSEKTTRIWYSETDPKQRSGGARSKLPHNSGESRHLDGNVSWNFKGRKASPVYGPKKINTPPALDPAVMLGHELAHAYMHHNLNADGKKIKNRDHEEIAASQAENQIRAELQQQAPEKWKKIRLRPRAEYEYTSGENAGKVLAIPRKEEKIINVEEHLLDCPKPKKVGFLFPEGRPNDETRTPETYRIATQLPEVCVGTTYVVSEKDVLEEGLPLATEEGEDPRDVPKFGGPIAVAPEEEEPGDSEDPRDVPLEEAPKDIPVALTPKHGEDPRDVPRDDAPGDQVTDTPITSTPEFEGDPRDTPQDDEPVPDLGKVKAVAEVVALAVTNAVTGTPVTGVGIKFLPDEPPLPGSQVADALSGASDGFDGASFFEADAEGGFTNEAGEIKLASLTIPASMTDDTDESGETPSAKAKELKNRAATDIQKNTDASPDSSETPRRISLDIDSEPNSGIVIGLKNEDALAVAIEGQLLASLVTNTFNIGQQPIVQLVVPRTQANEVNSYLKSKNWVSWFEPDPCWSKQ